MGVKPFRVCVFLALGPGYLLLWFKDGMLETCMLLAEVRVHKHLRPKKSHYELALYKQIVCLQSILMTTR